MSTAAEVTQKEVGHRLAQIREAAGVKQADLARKITWSPAVLSRVESGERQLSSDELATIAEAIGTTDALELSKTLGREWIEIHRPALDHPDQDLLWEAELVCRDLVTLRNNPDIRRAFERRLTEYIDDIKQTANLLLKRDHEVAFIGSKGIGKSTAICKATGLEVPGQDGGAPLPVLEAGGGGVTICDVHLRTGQAHGVMIEACTDEDVRAHVTDFAEHIMRGTTAEPEEDTNSEDEARGISQEMERAIRNLANLKVHRSKGPDGKTTRRDEAKELAAKAVSIREFVVDVLTRMELHRRDRRDIWFDPSTGKEPLVWLKEVFEQVNNGRHPDFTVPNRIEIFVPGSLLGTTDLTVNFIDTRGIDRTAARADLERHLDEPHTLALLCSGFNEAPAVAATQLLERAKAAGVRRIELNGGLLVLPRGNDALGVKDEAGVRAQTVEEGYSLKEEAAAMNIGSLGFKNFRIGFFNAFSDDPARLRDFVKDGLAAVRQSFRDRIDESIRSARSLLDNHEKAQVQEVLRSAAGVMTTWIGQNRDVPALSGHVHDSLMSQIHASYAATVRAAIRREGEWRNLSYGHHLGYGARRLAVLALDPLVKKFQIATEIMEADPQFSEAGNLIQQSRRVLDSAFEEMLRKTQLMGQTVFKDALKQDPSLWTDCEDEWGRGPGYRDRVAGQNQKWFSAEPRRDLEQELWEVVTREWSATLNRLSSLLETDASA